MALLFYQQIFNFSGAKTQRMSMKTGHSSKKIIIYCNTG